MYNIQIRILGTVLIYKNVFQFFYIGWDMLLVILLFLTCSALAIPHPEKFAMN